MKTNNTKILSLCYIGAALFLILFMGNPAADCYAMQQAENANDAAISIAESREANIGWWYQKIGNTLYKRLYNYDTEQWIGDWIKVS